MPSEITATGRERKRKGVQFSRPPPQEFRGYFSTHLLSPVAGPNKSQREQSDFKFFTLNFTLSREFHPFENRAFLERSRAGPHRISIIGREEPLNRCKYEVRSAVRIPLKIRRYAIFHPTYQGDRRVWNIPLSDGVVQLGSPAPRRKIQRLGNRAAPLFRHPQPARAD